MPSRKPILANADLLKKDVTDQHTSLAGYITATTGVEVDAMTVGLVLRGKQRWDASPSRRAEIEDARAHREAEKKAREQRRTQKARERLARIEKERQRVLALLGDDGDVDLDVEQGPRALTLVCEQGPEPYTVPTKLMVVPDAAEAEAETDEETEETEVDLTQPDEEWGDEAETEASDGDNTDAWF